MGLSVFLIYFPGYLNIIKTKLSLYLHNLKNFDGILSMYHDQGLTAFKTLSFNEGINFTAGLNIVRTSPVHGTAYDVAGKGNANERSFRQAVFLACEIYKKRTEFKLINENPFEFKSKK